MRRQRALEGCVCGDVPSGHQHALDLVDDVAALDRHLHELPLAGPGHGNAAWTTRAGANGRIPPSVAATNRADHQQRLISQLIGNCCEGPGCTGALTPRSTHRP